jgi:transcriptional regulator with XRE-family HTH domain
MLPFKTVEYANFGEFLNVKRREREIPSLQMAEKIGLSPTYYCDIEKNRRYPPDRDTLARIIRVLCLNSEEGDIC